MAQSTFQDQYQSSGNLDIRIALHRRYSRRREHIFSWVRDQYALTDGMRVLEVGCGTGEFWTINAASLPRQLALTLTDHSAGMIEKAKVALAILGPRFAIADVQDLPYETGSFDAVLAHFMLYHVPDKRRAISELHRVVAKHGFVGVVTNSRHHMARIKDLVRPYSPHLDEWDGVMASFREENAEELLRIFSSVEKSVYEDCLEVTESRDLLDYILSMCDGRRRADIEAMLPRVEEKIAAEIREKGFFAVPKRSALFSCRP